MLNNTLNLNDKKIKRNIPIKFRRINKLKILKFVFTIVISVTLILGISIPIVRTQNIHNSYSPMPSKVIIKENINSSYNSKNEINKLLVICNLNHQLPVNYKVNLTEFDKIQCDEIIVENLNNMIKDAQKNGISLEVCDGYISADEQNKLFNSKVEELIKTGGFSKVRAQAEAEKSVLPGGKSEAQTGLSVSLIPNNYNHTRNSDRYGNEYKWLNKHCVEYGFILRYPKNKEHKTTVKFNPSYYRYVGIDNAKKMRELNMCLEEYYYYMSAQTSL